MQHIYHKAASLDAPTLLLLHGTGGTEHDLVQIGRTLAPGSALLGVKGNVRENGMARYFRRLAEGVFDEQDLVFRTGELKQFLDEAAVTYGFDRQRVIAVGYSNGANIAASLLFHYETVLDGAVLFHPMVPRRGITLPPMPGLPVFIGAGHNDPLCPPHETEELSALLAQAQADVHVHWEHHGHQLSSGEIVAARSWLQALSR